MYRENTLTGLHQLNEVILRRESKFWLFFGRKAVYLSGSDEDAQVIIMDNAREGDNKL